MIAPLDREGVFLPGFGPLSGTHVSDSAPRVFDLLRAKGILHQVSDYAHRYPVCWRCGVELVFRLVDEWFISMDELRYDIMEVTKQIRWIPSFGMDRELDWLRNMHDWMVSKKRYYGLALPIWECAACGHFEVIGDETELKEKAVAGWDEFEGHTPHRPWVDQVQIRCSSCGELVNRVPEVGNPWLDAGIVSFSTLQFRSNPDYWRTWYPADFISESFPGQFRNWFYSMLAMGTVLDNSPPFRSIFGYATLLAEDGREMHKSWGNSIEFNEAADRMGVDVMRWLYCRQKPENNLLFGYGRADEVRRQFLIPLWNVYSFFVTYANIDGWSPTGGAMDLASATPLDHWILARLDQVLSQVTDRLENFDAYGATLTVEPFLEDLTNWYVRRSRRRFWKGELDADKAAAYGTLYEVLTTLSGMLAPFVPFVCEAMYQNLVRGADPGARASVHHTAWPQAGKRAMDSTLLTGMDLVRRIVTLGHAGRAGSNLKVRQPLAAALVHLDPPSDILTDELIELVRDELNVKRVAFVASADSLLTFCVLPDNKVLGPRFGRQFPKVRAALSALDPVATVQRVRDGLTVEVDVDGETVRLAPDEIIIREEPGEGLAVSSERGVTVAMETALTPDLASEGLARDVIRRIQSLRKDASFELDDRIVTTYATGVDLSQAVEQWRGLIAEETLSIELHAGEPEVGATVGDDHVGEHALRLGVRRA